jgi:hypothetical protein
MWRKRQRRHHRFSASRSMPSRDPADRCDETGASDESRFIPHGCQGCVNTTGKVAQDSRSDSAPMVYYRSCRRSLLLLAWWQSRVDGRVPTRRRPRRWPDATDPRGSRLHRGAAATPRPARGAGEGAFASDADERPPSRDLLGTLRIPEERNRETTGCMAEKALPSSDHTHGCRGGNPDRAIFTARSRSISRCKSCQYCLANSEQKSSYIADTPSIQCPLVLGLFIGPSCRD